MLNQTWYQRLLTQPSATDILRDESIGGTPGQHAKANAYVDSVLRAGRNIEAEANVEGVKGPESPESPESPSYAASVEGKKVEGQKDSVGYASRMIPGNWPQRIEDSGLLPSFELDDSQIAAAKIIASAQYSALIGAAGTGKTTLVKYILSKIIYGDDELGIDPIGIRQLSDSEGPSIALCAFTGIATQVLSSNLPEWIRGACKTIHTLLEYKPIINETVNEKGEIRKTQIFVPTRDRGNKLNHDIIVIDEASMLGLDLWHNLVDAMRPGTKVILIGDLNQLRPVADQTMFAYALAEAVNPNGTWKVAELTTIHRQSEPAANRIIEAAHQVLNGQMITFDDSKTNPNWRVLGYRLKTPVEQAHKEIVGLADMLRKARIAPEIDPSEPFYYDPYTDRIMTAGNGYDENNTIRYVQQAGLNETLSRLIAPPTPEHPMYIIDAGMEQKRFAVGHRVMALKNEPPDMKDRVTNGMTGIIIGIEQNGSWTGIPESVGPEDAVLEYRRKAAKRAFGEVGLDADDDESLSAKDRFLRSDEPINFDNFWEQHGEDNEKKEKESFGGGPASHKVTVKFDNGAERVMSSKSQVQNIQLAYATTVHKAQGSQCDTAIVVVHHAVKNQLSREWLYTAITRAKKRVVILYTDYGLRGAIAKQQIFGATLAEKIRRYQQAMLEGTGGKRGVVKLTIDGEN